MKKHKNKIKKILIIISLVIIGIGVLSGIGVSTGLLDKLDVITHPSSPTFGFEILFQFAGSAMSVFLGLLIVLSSLGVVVLIWVIYGIILLIIKLTKNIKNKKILYIVLSLMAFAFACLVIIGIFSKEDEIEVIDGTIESIAYNINPDGDYRVYIKENNEYIPYLVIDNNYNNKGTLLVRENVYGGKTGYVEDYNGTISKDIIYNEQIYMEENVRYDNTGVDKFLINDFINYYDDALENLMIENELVFEDYSLTRKLFILSLGEVSSLTSFDDDKQLEYFSSGNKTVKNDIGMESIWWTRSDCGATWCAIGINGGALTTIGTNVRYGVRPAFVISSDTKIKKGYIQENEGLYVEKNLIEY